MFTRFACGAFLSNIEQNCICCPNKYVQDSRFHSIEVLSSAMFPSLVNYVEQCYIMLCCLLQCLLSYISCPKKYVYDTVNLKKIHTIRLFLESDSLTNGKCIVHLNSTITQHFPQICYSDLLYYCNHLQICAFRTFKPHFQQLC